MTGFSPWLLCSFNLFTALAFLHLLFSVLEQIKERKKLPDQEQLPRILPLQWRVYVRATYVKCLGVTTFWPVILKHNHLAKSSWTTFSYIVFGTKLTHKRRYWRFFFILTCCLLSSMWGWKGPFWVDNQSNSNQLFLTCLSFQGEPCVSALSFPLFFSLLAVSIVWLVSWSLMMQWLNCSTAAKTLLITRVQS